MAAVTHLHNERYQAKPNLHVIPLKKKIATKICVESIDNELYVSKMNLECPCVATIIPCVLSMEQLALRTQNNIRAGALVIVGSILSRYCKVLETAA